MAPTAPSAGSPKPPGTSTRSTPRLSRLAIHISTIGGTVRPSPSSHDEVADDSAKLGIETASTSSGPVAPLARSPFSPSAPSRNGPAIASAAIDARPIHSE